MKSNYRSAILMMSCLFFCVQFLSCNSTYDLKATPNFNDEIEQQQNLEFSFNKDIFPDSLLNRWDTAVYLEFKPAIKGMFKWSSSSSLAFSPSEGFEPGTEYTASVTNEVLKYSKKKYSINKEAIHFRTAPLRVTATHLLWTKAKSTGNIMVQLDMGFNYDVNLAEVAARLKLSSDGKAIGISTANSGIGKTLSLQFMPVNDKDEETPLQIELAKGIPVTRSKYVSDKDTSFTSFIPSRYNLTITGVTAQHTGTEGVIMVSTSQPLNEANLRAQVKLEPDVPFDITLNDGGFTITSKQLSASQVYQLMISTGIEGAFGGRLKHDYVENVSFGKLKPSITFINNKGMYISGAGYKNLALNIVNVPAVEVTVVKVYENNLEQFMRGDKRYGYNYDEDDDEGIHYEYYDTEDLGDPIFTKSYETAKLPSQGSSHVLHLDFNDKIKGYNGVYVITVRSKEHNWIQESKILSISDIGLIVKQEKDNIYVFANSIHNATAMPGVKISFISTNNQQLFTANTDNDGVAVFKDIAAKSPGFRVGMITAKKDDEFSFIWFDKTHIETSRFDVGGRVPNETGLIAMLYPERNLYRPGETIHLSAVIRNEQWLAQPDVPVKIKLIMPNGKELSTIRKILNEQGSCEVAFNPPPTAITGTYVAQVFTGNDVLLNSYEISVEEFMPDRMKVGLKTGKDEYKPGDNITAVVQADNLFGTPAAGRNYQCEFNIYKEDFSSEKYPGYDFALSNELHINTDNREGKTSDKGSATELFKVDDALGNSGMLKGNIMATVFDETGRPVHRYVNLKIYTQPVFVGVKCNEEYVSSRVPVRMGLVALDKNENPQTADAQIVVIQKQWHTVIQKDGNSYRYVSQPEEVVVAQQRTTISGANGSYTFTPMQSGEYEVRIFIQGSNNYVSKTLYAYGWGDTQYTSFEVNNEGNVDIKTEKKSYNKGEHINVLLTTPFEGRMLVTLERDHMIKYYYVTTKNKTASVSFTADEALLPNIYVTATLFRPMDGSDMPLTVAHGFKSIAVTDKNYELPVQISVAEKSRSKTKQTIKIKTTPGAFVTIAAVDEGILQVKNFETPDPYNYFYQKVALAVNSYDIYPWLLPEIRSRVSSTGGDGAANDGSRVNPMFVNRVKNVSFWSGIKQADGSGHVKYDIDIPQFSGDIRVMAYVYKNKGFGSADKHMKVADPIVVSTALPRFLSPKDEVVMPVSMSNTTNRTATAVVNVVTTGPVGVVGEANQTIQIPANSEQRAIFNVAAQQSIGPCKITVTVKAMGESFVNETEIGVRPPASLQKITGSGVAQETNPGHPDTKSNFIPSSARGKLTIGKSPLTQFCKHIDDLVRYPFGCVEQTTSAAFPQLYYADLVKSLNSNVPNGLNPAYNVQQAINKLQSMQQGDGGLSYWPEGGEESWWGSVYACHFLIEARKAGYEVNAHTLDRLEEYMKYKLYKKELTTFYYNGSSRKDVAPEEIPYSLYVLAVAGQPQQSSMNYYKAHKELLTLDGMYLLAAAYSLSGQPTQAKEVLPPAFSGEIPNDCLGGSFYSYIRDLALSLNVLMDMDPANSQTGTMAKQLTDQMSRSKYMNTQEKAFSMLALGKIARLANQTTATASVSANGSVIGNSRGENLTIDMKPHVNEAVTVNVKGKGNYYYFWEMDGISIDGSYKEEDSYMRVRRTYFDRSGNEMRGAFRQNDLVVVRITIEAQSDMAIENVAITDILPAGFEIENARLNEMRKMEWIKEESEPDYIDIRDDRINMFTTVSKARKNFYYMVRAVSPGTYQLGPVQADAMYNGNFHSYNGAGIVKIAEH